ncbi:hypothetical protein ACH4U6_16235 [Streptomyces netropsis]|uniref:hypothetical protein n=1 Tax=Streptomyces netropsis TaxID=55404 RepID=UPI0037875CD4
MGTPVPRGGISLPGPLGKRARPGGTLMSTDGHLCSHPPGSGRLARRLFRNGEISYVPDSADALPDAGRAAVVDDRAADRSQRPPLLVGAEWDCSSSAETV